MCCIYLKAFPEHGCVNPNTGNSKDPNIQSSTESGEKVLSSYIKDKKVLYISTKNLDYIRVVQELRLLSENAAGYDVIGSYSKNYFFRILVVYFKMLFVSLKAYDTVFIGFAPQLVIPFWNWKLRHSNVIIDFFISCYDTLCYDRKKVSGSGRAGHILHWLDKSTLDSAELVICDTNAHGKYFSDEFFVSHDKLYTLYLDADTDIYHPLNLQRPEYLKDKYIVLYFGSGLPLQGIDVVLKAMALLKDNEALHFFFIGPIKAKKLKNLKPVSENIEYIEWLPQSKLAKYIDMADLCLAGHFAADIEKARRVIAGKTYIYKAMGKRMILGDNAANRELFAESDKVMFVEMGNAMALAEKISVSSTFR